MTVLRESTVQHNTLHAKSLPRAFTGASVVIYEEVDNARLRLKRWERAFAALDGWEQYKHPDVAAGAVRITWDSAVWEFIDGDGERTHDGFRWNGVGVTPHRYIIWVRLRHRATGKVVRFVATHMISGVRGKGKAPRDLRKARWLGHIVRLRGLLKGWLADDEEVVVCGDFNNGPDEVALPAPLKLVASSKAETNGRIDQIWTTLRCLAGIEGRKFKSDHPAVRAVLTDAAKPDPEAPVFTPEEAIARARSKQRARSNIPGGAGWCLRETRQLYGVPALYTDAATAWKQAKKKHRTERTSTIPRGVPIFWTGGSKGHGHIAISSGDGDCYTTDMPNSGKWGWVRIDTITRKWGLDFVGWTEDLNGVTVWEPVPEPPVPPKPEPDPKPLTRGPEVDIALLAIGRAKAKPGSKRDKALAEFLAAGLAVPPLRDQG